MKHWAGRGLRAWALRPLALLYGALSAAHRGLYRHGLRPIARAPVPVLVVGNWVAGGSGKTPTLIALVEHLQRQGWTPGVVSRGHGRRSTTPTVAGPHSDAAALGDEPLLIYRRTRCPLAVGRRRMDAVQALLAAHPQVDLVLSDDGLQHHALARDLHILTLDARGHGNGWLLPAGPLRQNRAHRVQAGPVVPELRLYTDGSASTAHPGFVAVRQLTRALPLAAWWRSEHRHARPLHALEVPDSPNPTPWQACAALAQPEAYFEMLRRSGVSLGACHALPDHAPYDTLPWPPGQPVLVTEKDAVKLPPTRPGCEGVWVTPLDLHIEPAFYEALGQQLRALGFTPAHGPATP